MGALENKEKIKMQSIETISIVTLIDFIRSSIDACINHDKDGILREKRMMCLTQSQTQSLVLQHDEKDIPHH